MPSLKFVLCLTCLFIGKTAQEAGLNSPSVHQPRRFLSVSVGDKVTVQCFSKGYAALLFWYKQTLGQKPKPISSFYTYDSKVTFYDEFRNDPRFTVDAEKGNNHITISDVDTSDSATYYCANSYAYGLSFAEGTTVSVRAPDLNVPASVLQSVSGSVQPGGSVTLNCTVHAGSCDGEHSVYWFRDSGESRPGVIYTHGDRSDQCERKPRAQTHTCVYSLSLQKLNRSHAGTYYCAVVSCGQIVFGNRTKVDGEYEANAPGSLVYYMSGAFISTAVMVIVVAFSVHKLIKRNKCQRTRSVLSAPPTTNAEGCPDVDSLHYAALSVNLPNRPRKQRSAATSECVYSSVKQ